MRRLRILSFLCAFFATVAFGPRCNAAVVLVDLLPLDFTVGLLGPRERSFDINGDSVNDYRFDDGGGGSIGVYPLGANRLIARPNVLFPAEGFPDNVQPGTLLGLDPEGPYEWLGANALGFIISVEAHFGIFGRAYLGLEFEIGSQTHYGWVEFDSIPLSIHLLRAGYQSEPGLPIQVPIPEPGMTALLAGAALVFSRRRRTGGRTVSAVG